MLPPGGPSWHCCCLPAAAAAVGLPPDAAAAPDAAAQTAGWSLAADGDSEHHKALTYSTATMRGNEDVHTMKGNEDLHITFILQVKFLHNCFSLAGNPVFWQFKIQKQF